MTRPVLLVLTLVLVSAQWLQAQVCRLSVAGLNRNRRVVGAISAECPDPLHTAPFGNWGVTSNFGPKRNGRQFDGWCHDMRICDNAGSCRNVCRDGWYEWNSCTTHPLFQAPNCTLYNTDNCTAQVSTTDVNVLGTQTVDLPAACPASNGINFDRGGCSEVASYSRNDNFMSMYELDPITGDELIQSVYYPSIVVPLKCNAWGCPIAGSDWANPIAWQSPSEPKVFAEMAIVVNSGAFLDPSNVCRVTPVQLQAVSSASFRGGELAPDSIATIFTGDVAVDTEQAASQPLPATLSGIQVRIADASGQSRTAGLIYVSPRQINFVVPAAVGEGTATLSVVAGNTVRATGQVNIVRSAPGLYTQAGNGQGLAAAAGVLVTADGRQTSTTTQPFDMGGPSDQFVLVLFGTGIRGVSSLDAVRATVGGIQAQVMYAGAQATFAGLDQVNLLVPRSLAGRGVLDVAVTVDGKPTNPVQVSIR
jgi:uncharacterized protein (TIGR03437 family)